MTQRKRHINWLLHTNMGNRNILVAISIAITVVMLCFSGFRFETICDTGTYLAAGDVIFSGHLDRLRTPIYPIICHIATSLLQYKGFYLIALLQLAVFYISIIYAHKAACLALKRRSLRFVAAALYAWSASAITFCICPLTESLTISSVVVFIYLFFAIISARAKRRHYVAVSFLLTLMILLRPFNICFSPVLILAILIGWKKNQAYHKTAIFSFVAGTLAIIAYCATYKAEYGKFNLSSISTINHAIIQSPDAPFITDTYYELADADSTISLLCWKIDYTSKEMCQADSIFQRNILRHATSRITQFDLSTDYYYPVCYSPLNYDYILPVQSMKLGQIYLVLIVIALCQFYILYRKRTLNYHIILILLMIFATIFTALWGCDNRGYARLMMPMLPCLCLLLSLFLEQIEFRLKTGKE